jgi:hypothetical protein
MTTKTNVYTEGDMAIKVELEESFKPKSGVVRITNRDSESIRVNVNLDDARIPKLINGDYTLKVAEATADHVWYKTK